MNPSITMKAQILLLLAVFSSSISKFSYASRNLPRGSDTFPYPDLGGAGGAALGGLWWLLNPQTTDPNSDPGAPALDPTPDPETPSQNSTPDPEIPAQNPAPDPSADSNPQTKFELQAEDSQPAVGFDNCDPGSDSFALPGSVGDCQPAATSQLIFTRDCASPHEEIENRLNQINPPGGWYASTNDECGLGTGVEFYGADLTPGQVGEFEAMIGVLTVVTDEALVDVEGSADFPSDPQFDLTDPSFKLRQKRDRAMLQRNAFKHLLFLSYPHQIASVEDDDLWTGSWPGYRYFSRAGAGVVVYVIENGANPENDEFRGTGVIQGWLYAGNIARTEAEYVPNLIWKGHGSCGVSLVAGPKYGVAKNAKVIIVKNSFSEGSILDAFQKIINDLDRRRSAGETIAGYTVVTLHGGFKKTTSEIKRQRLGQAIRRLLNDYQVVVVIAAGNSQQDGDVEIDTWPQLFSFDPLYSSMITVGAVARDTGAIYPGSKGSPGANVWAPGVAYCAYGYSGGSADSSSGTSVAAPIVAGLAAYFLSLADVGEELRQSANIPMAVLQLIQRFSQPRNSNYPSVWNGLNSLQQGPNYGWQP